jgi:Rhodanese-like domain
MTRFVLVLALGLAFVSFGTAVEPAGPPNPAIDMDGFLRLTQEAARHRATRRLTEAEFLRMSAEPGTVILDARSRQKYDLLHVRGAINLSFPDITVESLRKTLPDKSARVLIYCNNNFKNAEAAFPSKLPTASLNLSTYVSLYTYGYRNIYELGPQVDAEHSKLPLEATVKR